MPDHITNDAGQIALRYIRQQKAVVNCGPQKTQRTYIFSMRANISMAWVEAEDVPCCLAVRGGCCGQTKPGVIRYASETDVRRWTNGGGR